MPFMEEGGLKLLKRNRKRIYATTDKRFIKDAKIIAGYSPSTNNQEIIQSLKEEILEATQLYMASNAPKAAMAMVEGLFDPTELGIRDKMIAAKELLDRTGLIKTEKVQVESTGGVMLMPAKKVEKDD